MIPVYPDETGYEKHDPARGARAVSAPAGEYATFWWRAGAALLDGVAQGAFQGLLAMLSAWLVLAISEALLPAGGVPPRGSELHRQLYNVLLMGYALLGDLLNHVVLQGLTGGTVGKRLLGLRVARDDGSRLTLARAWGRYFARWLSQGSLGIGFLFVFWTSRRQALHDLIAGTVVYKEIPNARARPETL